VKEGATADRILAAADDLFCRRGYSGVSVRDIADQASVRKALVFYHFGSKDKLYEKVLTSYYDAHRAALSEPLATASTSSASFRERVHGVVDSYLSFIDANARYARLVQHEVAGGESAWIDFIRANLAPLQDSLTEVLHEVLPDRGHLAARHFFVSFSGIVLNYYTYAPVFGALWPEGALSEPMRQERRDHVRWLVDAMMDAIEE